MIIWLYQLPDVLILLIFIVATLLAMRLVHECIHRFFSQRISAHDDQLVSNIYQSIVILTSLVLTFSLVEVINTTHDVQKLVSTEASYVNNLDRILVRWGDPKIAAIREPLHRYTQLIVEQEWPALRDGHEDLQTRQAVIPVATGVIDISPKNAREEALYAQALTLLSDIHRAREDRIEYARFKLPSVYWYVIILAFLFQFMVSALLEKSVLSSWILRAQISALAALFALVFIFNRPYQGESGVKPEPLKYLLKVMDNRKM